MFGKGSYIDFFGLAMGLVSEIENKKRREQFGITNENGYDGVTRFNIPHIYSHIEVKNMYYCQDSNLAITCYDLTGKKMFTSGSIEYLKHDMFLVQEVNNDKPKDEWGYALYENDTKLTDFIFRTAFSQSFNDCGFALLKLKDFMGNEVVVNRKGDILFENEKYFDRLYLKGVLLKTKETYINLLTNKVICNWKWRVEQIDNGECLFVKTEETCVYQINIETGDYIIHGKEKEVKPIPPTKEELELLEQEEEVKRQKQQEKELEAAEWLKLTRNNKCRCGSGKKFKSCCINKWEYNLRKK